MNAVVKQVLGALSLLLCVGMSGQTAGAQEKLLQQYRESKDTAERVKLLITMSETGYIQNRHASEMQAIHAYTLANTLKSKELSVRALIRLINVTFENSNNPKAIYLTSELLKRLDELPDHKYHAEAQRIAGRNYHLRGDYPQALRHYFEGLKYCEELKDTVQAGELYNSIGGVYYNQGDVKNAYDYYNRGLQVQIKYNNKLRTGRGYLNIGSVYITAREFDKAKTALDSAMLNYTRAGYEEGKIMVYTTLPEVYAAANQQDSALKYLNAAYDYLKKNNRTFYIPQIDLQVARLLIEKGKNEEALLRIETGIKAGLLNRQNHDLAPLYLLKSEVLDKAGKSKEAFESFKLYKILSDSVLNAASIKKQTEEALNYEFNKKEFEQKLQNEEKEQRQRFMLFVSIALTIVLFFIFYYRYRLKQRANKLLENTNLKLAEKNNLIEEKSRELQESLNERELLLKEIHHRVKNNLQVISGLLELQKEELTEDGSKAAFDEGQSRIRSISLIHQNLYQNEKLGSIKFKTFVTELAEQVKEVFEQEKQELKVELDMPDNILDIDTAVPLGLILNELLTNSYKYAVSDIKEGLVHIFMAEQGGGNFILRYSDNGPGIKAGTDFDSATTLGLRLIKGLSGQLAGKARYYYDNGAVFEINFKDSKARLSE